MRVTVNGRVLETEETSLHRLRRACGPAGEESVALLNGVQTGEDLTVRPGDRVILLEPGKLPGRAVYEAMLRERYTPQVCEKLRRARVAVAGLGGLGSAIAAALARTGVGYLHLVDFDRVEPSNLNRQQYDVRHLGLPKTEALKGELEEISPYLRITTDTVRVTEDNAPRLFEGDGIVCEAFDRPEAKAMLVSTLLERFPGKKIVSASGMAGYGSGNAIVTRRPMKNLYLCGDGETGAAGGRGLMAPRVLICAGHQANMVLRLILGIEDV